MADLSALGELRPVEMLDLDCYQDAVAGQVIPKKGEYTLQAPESFPSAAFGRAQSGALLVQIDPKIVGPTSEGYTIRFTKVSAKPFRRGDKVVSQLGDYLRACGVRGRYSDEQAQADAVEQTTNRVYKAEVDWKAYNKNTKFAVEGMENFPSDGKGGRIPWIEDPNDFEVDEGGSRVTDAQGNPIRRRLRANAYISRFIPAE